MKQQIAFCTTSDGVRIAYAKAGAGSPVVRASHWMTHLEQDFKNPIWRHVMLGFAQRHELLRYDARGEGMSQREVGRIDFDSWISDLEAVVDAAGHERFAIFGASQGAATAIAYAVRHPERVSHLILYGGFADSRHRWQEPGSLELACNLIRQGWGASHDAYHQWFCTRFLPEGSTDQFRHFSRIQRQSATPEVAERHLIAAAQIDVFALLPRVATPTLVLHCKGDIIAPVECGEEIAAGIPGARFVPLEGQNHLFLPGSSAHRKFAEEVAEFLGDPPPPRRLPGTGNLHQHANAMVGAVEGNWLIKLLLLTGAVIGLVLSVMQLSGMLG